MAWLLAIIWSIPAMARAWRMARYFQLEEYKTDRFLRWLGSKRAHWFPRPRAVVMLAAVVATFTLQLIELDVPIFNFGAWVLVAIFSALPEPVKETKKTFVRTPRAMRILGTSFVLCFVLVVGVSLIMVSGNSSAALSSVAIIGFLVLLLSPLMLPLANGIMYPVEAFNRRRFWQQAHQRLQDSGAVTIGITGSYGKTSTKSYLSHILNGKFNAYPTPKSYNTIMGVSLAINTDFEPGADYFIAEMGAYVPGEIAGICELTHPQISIVTAVGPMHLERFGTIDNVVKAKYEIVEGLPEDGVGVFNGDDPRVREMAARGYPQTRMIVSQEGLDEARILAENVEQTLEGLRFELHDRQSGERHPLQTGLMGLHNVTNILLASAVAVHLGMSLAEIAAQVATLESAEHRLQQNRLANGITIIDDAYSANPAGAASALEVLKLYDSGRRILITPGMVELGDLQDAENEKLGTLAAAAATDIVLVGIEQTEAMKRGIDATDFDPAHLLIVDTFDEAREWFQTQVRAGDTVLFLNDLPDTYL